MTMRKNQRRWSNPLDWRPIDRHILLGVLLLLLPAVLGGCLGAALWLAPGFVNSLVASLLLGFYALYGFALGCLLFIARQRRKKQADWPLLENFIVASFIISVILSSWLAGTLFTQGLLLLSLGVNIASALANIHKIYLAYLCVCVTMVVLAVVEFSHIFPHAPLFAQALPGEGSVATGWLVFEVLMAAILLAITRITIAIVKRWVDRENLYREMSSIDGLTRLSNRRSFIERGQSEILRVQRSPLQSVGCVMVDLDHFKAINDTWGHHAGDEVLVVTSRILMEKTRQYDEVGRYGGEEFAILMPGLALKEATGAAERIRAAIAGAIIYVDDKAIPITASLGVASYPAPGINNLNDLLKAADQALYKAKNSGRNRVVSAATLELNP